MELSHEAAVGKFAEEEVLYLMTRGLTRAQATSAIVRGFLRLKVPGLPAEVQQQLEALIARMAEESF